MRRRNTSDDDSEGLSELSGDGESDYSDEYGFGGEEVDEESNSPQNLRLVNFNALRDASIALPFPQDSDVRVKSKPQTVSIFIDKVSNFSLPRAIAGSTSNSQVAARISVSLFHLDTGAFYGNTWLSAPTKIKSGRSLNFQQSVAFKTKALDSSCLAVAEIIVEETNKKSGHVIRRLGCGWSMLNIFAERLRKAPKRSVDIDTLDAPVFTGSPRALVLYKGKTIQESDFKAQRKCALQYATVLHPKFERAARLIADNEIIGASSHVPGFKRHLDAHEERIACIGADRQSEFPLPSPSLVSTMQLRVKQVKVMLPNSFGEAIADYLRVALDVESDERKGKYVLRLGAHNGHVQLSPKGWAKAGMKKAKASTRGYVTYTTTSPLSVSKVPKDPMVALAFELGYEVPITGDGSRPAVATIAIGSCYWLPFSGGRTHLSNNQKFKADTKLPLQLEVQVPSDNLVKSSFSLPPRSSNLPILCGIKFGDAGVEDDDGEEDIDTEDRISDSDIDSYGDSDGDSNIDDDSDLGIRKHRGRRSKKRHSGDDDDYDDTFSNSEDDASIDVPSINFKKSLALRKRRMQQSAATGNPLATALGQYPAYASGSLQGSLLAASLRAPVVPQSKSELLQDSAIARTTNMYDPTSHLTLHPQKLSNNLSRASSAYLSQHGYYDVRGDGSRGGQQGFAIAVPLVKGSIDAELADPRTVNEFTFQFAAYRVVKGINAVQPKSIFLRFNFTIASRQEPSV